MATHALVKWATSNDELLMDIVEATDIKYDVKIGLIEDKEYTVKFNGKKYKACVKFIGNFHCVIVVTNKLNYF